MFEHTCEIRVRYAETDQMGLVYYGNYALYFETARTEAMRSINMPYTELERRGVIMPVVDMKCRYKKGAHYDDNLRIVTKVKAVPDRNMVFYYEIFNEKDELLHVGETTLLFVEVKTGKLKRAPEELKAALKAYF